MRDASCGGTLDPDAFFAERGQSKRRLEAQKLCMSCPVRDECSDYQVRMDERFGIWGGKLQTRNKKQ
ncbi:WhiB [Rhodococcus phage ReqiDocB7]|uniref:transcriptional regulator WhiB-like n=1 Tax=Rhodococcus phage ReqiDocB7 TaxID=691966 RepID=UPI0001CDD764|nr:transcriptional regulator WhiB-like [Rhodococcus phage ReqiDocB7]ADD80820.1 WhiB [Rhodococcus phage ReqiDocB7]